MPKRLSSKQNARRVTRVERHAEHTALRGVQTVEDAETIDDSTLPKENESGTLTTAGNNSVPELNGHFRAEKLPTAFQTFAWGGDQPARTSP